jgi:hypothetical protein
MWIKLNGSLLLNGKSFQTKLIMASVQEHDNIEIIFVAPFRDRI